MERWGRIDQVEARSADQGGKWFAVGACAAGNITCTAVPGGKLLFAWTTQSLQQL